MMNAASGDTPSGESKTRTLMRDFVRETCADCIKCLSAQVHNLVQRGGRGATRLCGQGSPQHLCVLAQARQPQVGHCQVERLA